MLEDIQRYIDEIMHEENNREMPDFEGYSPFEMHHLLHFTFGEDSPIELQLVSKEDYQHIPILNQLKYFLDLIRKSGEMKLTQKGFLPLKIVKDIYDQGFMEDNIITPGSLRVFREKDSMTVNLTRIFAEITGLIKKRNNKLSLTKKGEKLISNDPQLLELIFTTYCTRVNWAYYDGYGDNNIGQLGFGFSLILLHKYGSVKRLDKFYADKYFKAFPLLLDELPQPSYGTLERFVNNCYSLRTFERFLDYFGLIKIEAERKWDADKFITKTDLLDRLIKVWPHRSGKKPCPPC